LSLVIYHNPRCSKSRQTLALLEENGHQPEVVEYLKNPPTVDELTATVQKLGLTPRDIIRTKEAEYKESGLDNQDLTDDQVLDLMNRFPKVIERPIVINGDKAAVGRPPENVLNIL